MERRMKDPEFETCIQTLSDALTPMQVPLSLSFPDVVLKAFADAYLAFRRKPSSPSRSTRRLAA
ncbi:MAG: hypothetical protein AAF500_14970 [Myxococcota bacterium]